MKKFISILLSFLLGAIVMFHVENWLNKPNNLSYYYNTKEPVKISYLDPVINIYYNSDLTDGPIIIMDNEYAKVSIIKYLAKDYWWEFGYEFKIVNKTNKVLTALIDDCSIMDVMCKPLFSIDHVEAGHTAYFTVAWDRETLERSHLPYIDNIEFLVRVYNGENWKMPALAGSKILLKK